jgi:hypothetical protein
MSRDDPCYGWPWVDPVFSQKVELLRGSIKPSGEAGGIGVGQLAGTLGGHVGCDGLPADQIG